MSYIGAPDVTGLPELESMRRLREGGPGSGPQGGRKGKRSDQIKSKHDKLMRSKLSDALKDMESKHRASTEAVHDSLKKASASMKSGDLEGAADHYNNALYTLNKMGWGEEYF